MSYSDRKAVAAALRPIYQAPSEEAAWEALETFEASELGQRYPAAVRTFTDSWERFARLMLLPVGTVDAPHRRLEPRKRQNRRP